MKKNGFTLVEVLAMITVIGIIMLVSIPNISGMMKNQRLNYLKGDATSMVEAAKMKVSKSKEIEKIGAGDCIVFSLNYLDENENMVKGPNGGKYDQFESIVVYTREDTATSKKYKYYVRLVEIDGNKKNGITFIDSESINSLTGIKEAEGTIGLTETTTQEDALTNLSVFASITQYCNIPVKGYYSGLN